MNANRFIASILLLGLIVLVLLCINQDSDDIQFSSRSDNTAVTPTAYQASPLAGIQDTSAARATTNVQSSSDPSAENPLQRSETASGADDGTISLDEILSRMPKTPGSNVFPQQYQIDIETTALLTDVISHLDKDALELHVFSAECYEELNECRVHYQANDSLVLYLMGRFEGMSLIGDHVTESGDTVLMIEYRPLREDKLSGADK